MIRRIEKLENLARRYQEEKKAMVEEQIVARGITSKDVIDAMLLVPRHLFIPGQYEDFAYDDRPLPIGHDQTISQPYIVALMTEVLELKGNEKVMEVGTGSGYQAAILGLIAERVITIEVNPALAEGASNLLKELGFENIRVVVGDGSQGFEEEAPYDAIVVTAASPQVPEPLYNQLKEGGRLVIPVGSTEEQVLIKLTKYNGFEEERLCGCRFVPLIGKYGFK